MICYIIPYLILFLLSFQNRNKIRPYTLPYLISIEFPKLNLGGEDGSGVKMVVKVALLRMRPLFQSNKVKRLLAEIKYIQV